MKKPLLSLSLLILVLLGICLALSKATGYVLLVLSGTTIEVPIWIFFLGLLVTFFLLYCLIKTLRWLLNFSANLQRHLARKKALEAKQYLEKSLFLWLVGEETASLDALKKAKALDADPLVTNAFLAWLSQKQKDEATQIQAMTDLAKTYPQEQIAVQIFKAKLQLSSGQVKEALAILEPLFAQGKKQVALVKLLAHIYFTQGNYSALAQLLPLLKKTLEAAIYQQYAGTVLVAELSTSQSQEALFAHWRADDTLQYASPVLAALVHKLIRFNLANEAEFIVREHIERGLRGDSIHLDESLYSLYASIPYNAYSQITAVEHWLKQSAPHTATLLFAAGNLCMRFQVWGKARDYFTSSLKHQPSPKVYAELARLHTQLGDKEKAAQCYQLGLELAIKK